MSDLKAIVNYSFSLRCCSTFLLPKLSSLHSKNVSSQSNFGDSVIPNVLSGFAVLEEFQK